jgi:H+/Cl- antiporter ClcA
VADQAPNGSGHSGPSPRWRLPIVPALVLALDAKLLMRVALVGAVAGVLASGYFYALHYALIAVGIAGEHVPVWALMPGLGVLVGLCWLLGEPGETDAVVDNIHVRNGRMDTRANLPLLPVSLLSIAAGGSAGPEAPMVYITGSVGTWLHRWLRLPEKEVRTLTLTGMSVGFATLFGAPIGSALFALEIPHKRGMEYYEATIPSMIGCLIGYSVFSLITRHGIAPVWTFPAYHFAHGEDLLIATVIGLGCGVVSLPYAWLIGKTKKLFQHFKVPMAIKAAVGGLILGLIAWKLPATRFWGEEQLQTALLDATPAVGMLLLLAAAKMLTVSVTLASGWRGGIIIPCFFIGACLGKAAALMVPGVDPTLAMIAGMAAVNVSVMKVPLATVFVLAAMTGIPAIAPIAAASFAAFVVSGGIDFLESKRERPDRSGDVIVDEAEAAVALAAEPEASRARP